MADTDILQTAAAPEHHRSAVKNILIFLTLIFMQEYFFDGLFRCPCREDGEECDGFHSLYGWSFVVGPAIFVGLMSIALDYHTWYACVGLKCNCSCGVVGDIFKACFDCKSEDPSHRVRKIRAFMWSIFQAFVLFMVWMSIGALDGDYIACAFSCDPFSKNTSCDVINSLPKDEMPYTREYERLKRTSQMAGGGGMILMAFLYLLGQCCCRCCCYKYNYTTFRVIEVYNDTKREKLDEMIQEKLGRELAGKIVTTKPIKDAFERISERDSFKKWYGNSGRANQADSQNVEG